MLSYWRFWIFRKGKSGAEYSVPLLYLWCWDAWAGRGRNRSSLLVGAGAYLTDPGLEALEIQKGVRTAAGVPQDGGGVEHGHHGHAGLFKPKTVLPGDFEIRLDETHGGDPPQTDDDLWTDEGPPGCEGSQYRRPAPYSEGPGFEEDGI